MCIYVLCNVFSVHSIVGVLLLGEPMPSQEGYLYRRCVSL